MSPLSSFGRRFNLKQAAAYLDMPVKRLRALVELKQITCVRYSGVPTSTKPPLLEFYEADLDTYIRQSRIEAIDPQAAKVEAIDAPRRRMFS